MIAPDTVTGKYPVMTSAQFMIMLLMLGAVGLDAGAYQVRRVCEEVMTKQGRKEHCRTVLDNSVKPVDEKDKKDKAKNK